MKNIFDNRTLVLMLLMVLIISLRVVAPLSENFSFIANFSGIGAVALFGGFYLHNRWSSFLLPVFVLFLSDLGLVLTMGKDYGFYEGWYYTYLAFALIVLVGRYFYNQVSVRNIFCATLSAVFIHWIVSDFGVWFGSTLYPQTLLGFWACLVAAIPFELKFLYGTLVYSALMFGVFETLKAKYPALKLSSN
jgi:hypothetical protein